jgi:hypothetical protein
MLVNLLKIPDNPCKVVHKGCKVFIYDALKDQFINIEQYNTIPKDETKGRIFMFPCLNLNNAIKKVNKYFRSGLKK